MATMLTAGRLLGSGPCPGCRLTQPRHFPLPILWPTVRRIADGRARTLCMAERRRMIIKRRTPPAAQRKKRRFADEPHSLDLDVQSTRFVGRLTTEINSANGPLQLLRLIQEYGLHFSGTQVTMALARLASFATFQQLSSEQTAAQARATRRCVLLLRQRLGDCDLISYARASYSLGRLNIYDEDLMSELVEEVYDKLNLFSPDGLAALLVGIAALGHRPPDRWLDIFALEVYTRFGRFNGQELANVLYSMARLQYTPSATWSERCMECFRAAMSLPSVPPMAPAMVKFAFGLASLQIRPSFNWTTAFVARARPLLDALSSRELAVLLWSLSRILTPPAAAAAAAAAVAVAPPLPQPMPGNARPIDEAAKTDGHDGDARSGGDGAHDGTAATATAVAAAAAVGLDRAFLDAWFRCSSRRMSGTSPPALVLALQALAVLRVTQLPSKFVNAMLAQLQDAIRRAGPAEATDQRRGKAAQIDLAISAAAGSVKLTGAELVSALLSLVALRIRPAPDWMESCLSGLEPALVEMEAPILCDLAWALARLQYKPSPEWTDAFMTRCRTLYKVLTEQQVSLMVWALRQLSLSLPDAP